MPSINPQAVRGPVTAVPVVAGTGVRFVEDVQNNRVVAEVDETVLYTGTSAANTGNLSEAYTNFTMLRVTFAETVVGQSAYPGGCLVAYLDVKNIDYNGPKSTMAFGMHNLSTGNWGMRVGIFTLTGSTSWSNARYERSIVSPAADPATIGNMWVVEVVGINRVASA